MKTGNFTHSMRRNKCRIYSIYSSWNLTKIEWKSFRNERRKCLEMLFEEQIPCSRKILELSGNSESKFQQNLSRKKGGHPPCPGTIWAVPSGVPRNLTCCPNGDCYSNYEHSQSGSHNLPPNNFPLTPVIQTSFWASCEDQPLSEDWLYMTKTARIFTIFNSKNTPPRDMPHFS